LIFSELKALVLIKLQNYQPSPGPYQQPSAGLHLVYGSLPDISRTGMGTDDGISLQSTQASREETTGTGNVDG
jgi:hypothetical protein